MGLQESLMGCTARGGGSRGGPVWYSTRPWRVLDIATIDAGDAEPELSQHLGAE